MAKSNRKSKCICYPGSQGHRCVCPNPLPEGPIFRLTPGYYECHVTMFPEWLPKVEPVAKKHKFKTSVLVGDEVMGDAKLLYCTSHGKDFVELNRRMEALIKDLPGLPMRKKIEHVVLDVRY